MFCFVTEGVGLDYYYKKIPALGSIQIRDGIWVTWDGFTEESRGAFLKRSIF